MTRGAAASRQQTWSEGQQPAARRDGPGGSSQPPTETVRGAAASHPLKQPKGQQPAAQSSGA